MTNSEIIMSIFAHQDDETFSAGGTLAKCNQAIAISVTLDKDRVKEFENACNILGIKGIELDNGNVSTNNENKIREDLISLIQQYKPSVIITHTDFDYHYEHKAVRRVVEEAVEWASHTTGKNLAHQVSSLWAAETTVLIPFPHVYIDIGNTNQKRLEAIKCYETQSEKGGAGFYSRFHNTRTILRGIQSGVDHAEAYTQIPISQSGSFKPVKVYELFP